MPHVSGEPIVHRLLMEPRAVAASEQCPQPSNSSTGLEVLQVLLAQRVSKE
jgi:hypothetical protein